MQPPTIKIPDFRLSIRHDRFEAKYDHPNGSQLSLGKDQLETYLRDKGWARIFFCKNKQADKKEWSANDFLVEILARKKFTLFGAVLPEERHKFLVSGSSIRTHEITAPLDGFYIITDRGPVPTTEVKFFVTFTLSKRVTNPKKVEKTDKPFVIFSYEADVDYLLARLSSLAGASLHSRAGYFAHQACEKYLKHIASMLSESFLTLINCSISPSSVPKPIHFSPHPKLLPS